MSTILILLLPSILFRLLIKAVEKARQNGLTIPIVYNSSGYEKADTIKMLEGTVDIYLPDIKYFSCQAFGKILVCTGLF